MKKPLLFVVCLLFTTLISSQSFRVISNEKLNLDGEYVGVKLNRSGTKLLVSEKKSLNLLLFDLETNLSTEICNEGVNVESAVFSADGENIFFTKSYRLNNRIYKDLYNYNTRKRASKSLEKQTRNLAAPAIYANSLLYADNSKLKKVELSQTTLINSVDHYVAIENQSLIFYKNGVREVLNPCGDGSYIWPSLSPDGQRILFYEVRKGAFIYDISSKQLTSLGKVEAPVWVNDNWVTGMNTTDDGHVMLSGKIMVIDTKGNNKQDISPEEMISLYPSAAVKGQRIAYITDKGEVYVVNYSIN